MPKQPVLPSLYRVPWDTKLPMFPSEHSRLHRSRPRPMYLQSTFGAQVDSRKFSASGCIFAGRPMTVLNSARELSHESPRDLIPTRAGVRAQYPLDALYTPGPLNYRVTASIGPQPLSPFNTASVVSLHQSEDRWEPGNRVRRLNATPAPNAYFPR